MTNICAYCGRAMAPGKSGIFCSRECHHAARKAHTASRNTTEGK